MNLPTGHVQIGEYRREGAPVVFVFVDAMGMHRVRHGESTVFETKDRSRALLVAEFEAALLAFAQPACVAEANATIQRELGL